MKKFLLVIAAVLGFVSAQAQEMYLGGGISLWRNTEADRTSFSIAPDFGYNLSERWAVGGELGIAINGKGDNSPQTRSFAIAPYARYSYYENKVVRLFIDMGVGISTTKVKDGNRDNGFEIGFKPGLAIKLNDSFSFITKVGFAGYRKGYYRSMGEDGFGVTVDGENISIGIDYEF